MSTQKRLHSWEISPLEAYALQLRLRNLVTISDTLGDISHVAGVDVSYGVDSEIACCAISVFSYPEMECICSASSRGRVGFPYIPGLLAFREGPLIEQAYEQLDMSPDIFLFDGHGICHPMGLGIASHLGIYLGIATIGCAKTPFVGTYQDVLPEKGSTSKITHEGRHVGYALRTRTNVQPVFVSPGHHISLERSVHICLSCTGSFRIPEPLRHAHSQGSRILAGST
ncbi:MAG: endonuclease V [Desulfomonilia bacterium]